MINKIITIKPSEKTIKVLKHMKELKDLQKEITILKFKNKELKKQLSLCGVINWVAYNWNKPSTHPPKAGRYLIYRKKCNKIHFEQWNGSGWSSSNNDCTHYTLIKPPCL